MISLYPLGLRLLVVGWVDVILLPTFEISVMSRKAKRRIRSKSVRQMFTLSQYKFKQFIKHKAQEYDKIVVDLNEAYTSKTVSWTGEIINNLGGGINCNLNYTHNHC